MKSHYCFAERAVVEYENECNWCGETEMTQDEIIRMAREAGLFNPHNEDLLQDKEVMAQFERFAALVAAHEREKQAEQEPVAWLLEGGSCVEFTYCDYHDGDEWTPLYAAPVRTKDLTDDDLEKTYDEICRNASSSERLLFRYGRAVIAADREKNK